MIIQIPPEPIQLGRLACTEPATARNRTSATAVDVRLAMSQGALPGEDDFLGQHNQAQPDKQHSRPASDRNQKSITRHLDG